MKIEITFGPLVQFRLAMINRSGTRRWSGVEAPPIPATLGDRRSVIVRAEGFDVPVVAAPNRSSSSSCSSSSSTVQRTIGGNRKPGANGAPGLRAFTLLELLLAIVVFAIVLCAIQVVFFSALKLRNSTSESLERALPLQQTLAIIKRDLANLVPPGGTLSGALQSTPTVSPMGPGMGLSSSLNRQGGPQFYAAIGSVDDNAPWADLSRVSYFLAGPTNNTPGQDLYRSVARNLLPLTQDETEDQFLMSGVESIAFQYYDGNAWKDTWDSTVEDPVTALTNQLPGAIKLQLQLHQANRAAGIPAPVELIVPVLVRARTNVTGAIE